MSYVHGYSERESERLYDQSFILEEILHKGTSYNPGETVLEAGCGVGAQTKFLAQNNPQTHFTSVDISEISLEKAKNLIEQEHILNVHFQQENIFKLSFDDNSFDHIFICFVLEHLDEPLNALKEVKRVLKPGGSITVIEGDHGSCFWTPETDNSLKVWHSLIKAQQSLGHDPNIGRRLYPLLKDADFEIDFVEPRWIYCDQSNPEKANGMVNKIIVPMVKSSTNRILSAHIVDEKTWKNGLSDLEYTGLNNNGTFFYTWFKGIGYKK